MKNSFWGYAAILLFLLAVGKSAFATDYLCIQNSSSFDFTGSVIIPNNDGVHGGDMDNISNATIPAHSGGNWNWRSYCIGADTLVAGGGVTLHVFLTAPNIQIFIDWENPLIGSPGLSGGGITVSGTGVDTQFIGPHAAYSVVRVCDAGMKCVDN